VEKSELLSFKALARWTTVSSKESKLRSPSSFATITKQVKAQPATAASGFIAIYDDQAVTGTVDWFTGLVNSVAERQR
jgi:hypothetical protein